MKMYTILAIALLIAACATTTPTGRVTAEPGAGQPQLNAEPIVIGGLFALTGDGAAWGTEEMRSAQLAVDEANAEGGINGTRITLAIEDTQTLPRVTANAMQRFVQDGIQVVIGPTWEESAASAAPIAEERKIALLSPSVSEALEIEKEFDYSFATFYSDSESSQLLHDAMIAHGARKVAIVYNLNSWSSFRRDIFVKQAHDMEVIEFPLPDGTYDFRTPLLKIKAENVDAVYSMFTADESIQPFMKQSAELGINVPYYSASGTENTQIAAWYGAYSPGVTHVFLKENSDIIAFKQRYAQRYGEEPLQPCAPVAYDTTRLVIAALRSGARTGTDVVNWLNDVEEFSGVGRSITFDEHGWAIGGEDVYVLRAVVNGTFVDAIVAAS